MLRAHTLTAVAAIVMFAAPAPAQTPPATTPAAVTPTPATAPTVETKTVTVVTWYSNPIVKWIVPVAAVMAIGVIGLFVARWRRTGEIPGPPVGP